jgi:hypothetical protein
MNFESSNEQVVVVDLTGIIDETAKNETQDTLPISITETNETTDGTIVQLQPFQPTRSVSTEIGHPDDCLIESQGEQGNNNIDKDHQDKEENDEYVNSEWELIDDDDDEGDEQEKEREGHTRQGRQRSTMKRKIMKLLHAIEEQVEKRFKTVSASIESIQEDLKKSQTCIETLKSDVEDLKQSFSNKNQGTTTATTTTSYIN